MKKNNEYHINNIIHKAIKKVIKENVEDNGINYFRYFIKSLIFHYGDITPDMDDYKLRKLYKDMSVYFSIHNGNNALMESFQDIHDINFLDAEDEANPNPYSFGREFDGEMPSMEYLLEAIAQYINIYGETTMTDSIICRFPIIDTEYGRIDKGIIKGNEVLFVVGGKILDTEDMEQETLYEIYKGLGGKY